MNTQHTPTPWTQGFAPGAHWVMVPELKGGINAKSADRAAFIVRACNAHDDLLAALKAVDWYLLKGGPLNALELSAKVSAALAKAGAA